MALENLQPPVEFFPNSYQEPSAPAFTPMVAPAAVRVSPASKFGPVTPSGYAQPPVDPLSYYSTPEPTPVEPTPYTGGPTRWYEVYRPTPDLSNFQSVAQPEQATPSLSNPQGFNPAPFSPADVSPSGPSQLSNNLQDEFPGYAGLGFGDEIPGMPGTRIGDVIKDDAGNIWNWREGRWDTPVNPLPNTPLIGPRFETDPVDITIPIEQQQPVVTPPPETVTNTPAPQTPAPQTPVVTPTPVFDERVTVTPPPKLPDFEFQEPPPTRNPIVLPGASVLSRPVITTPLPELPVNPVLTRNMETMPGRYFRDINYDPEEILAAAMRSMGGRMARRSILNELS